MFKRKEFTFYLPKLNKTIIIRAKDESYAVSKLFNQFRLREKDVDDYVIIKTKDVSWLCI